MCRKPDFSKRSCTGMWWSPQYQWALQALEAGDGRQPDEPDEAEEEEPEAETYAEESTISE